MCLYHDNFADPYFIPLLIRIIELLLFTESGEIIIEMKIQFLDGVCCWVISWR